MTAQARPAAIPPEPFERELSADVVLWNVSGMMHKHATKKYAKRSQTIQRVYVHHSGALGAAGVQGAINSSRYDVEHGKPPFPGAAYHLWFPFHDLLDAKGRRVVLRLNDFDTASWHTGGTANQHGLGACFQGNHGAMAPGEPLSANQMACAAAALRDLMKIETIDKAAPIAWHAIAQNYSTSNGKPSCPGAHTLDWLHGWLKAEGLPVPGGS